MSRWEKFDRFSPTMIVLVTSVGLALGGLFCLVAGHFELSALSAGVIVAWLYWVLRRPLGRPRHPEDPF